MRSILYPRLMIDRKYDDQIAAAGYCSDMGEYVLVMSGIWCDEMYHRITAEEYEGIMAHKDEEDTYQMLDEQAPGYFQRMFGAAGPRLHCLEHWPEGFKPYICMHGPYLYDDDEKMLYWHLFWDGVHYAAAPHFFAPYWILDLEPCQPMREIEGLDLCWVDFNGEKVLLCYGKKVDEFEGMDEWQHLYDHMQNGGNWNWKD